MAASLRLLALRGAGGGLGSGLVLGEDGLMLDFGFGFLRGVAVGILDDALRLRL
jgi:hypothetical protein